MSKTNLNKYAETISSPNKGRPVNKLPVVSEESIHEGLQMVSSSFMDTSRFGFTSTLEIIVEENEESTSLKSEDEDITDNCNDCYITDNAIPLLCTPCYYKKGGSKIELETLELIREMFRELDALLVLNRRNEILLAQAENFFPKSFRPNIRWKLRQHRSQPSQISEPISKKNGIMEVEIPKQFVKGVKDDESENKFQRREKKSKDAALKSVKDAFKGALISETVTKRRITTKRYEIPRQNLEQTKDCAQKQKESRQCGQHISECTNDESGYNSFNTSVENCSSLLTLNSTQTLYIAGHYKKPSNTYPPTFEILYNNTIFKWTVENQRSPSIFANQKPITEQRNIETPNQRRFAILTQFNRPEAKPLGQFKITCSVCVQLQRFYFKNNNMKNVKELVFLEYTRYLNIAGPPSQDVHNKCSICDIYQGNNCFYTLNFKKPIRHILKKVNYNISVRETFHRRCYYKAIQF